jgi:hypothetical protein
MRYTPAVVCCVVLAAVLFAGCEGTNPVNQNNNIVFPDSNVGYRQHVQPVFDLNCAFSGCHDDASSNGLRLTSWVNANADAGNIVPYDPDHSKLCQVLERKVPHNGSLDTNQNHIRGIRRWVNEGGKNN